MATIREETYQNGALVSSRDVTISATQANADDLRTKAQQAIVVNTAFLSIPAVPGPTNAQVLSQVQRLTRSNTALIRLILGLLDDTSGT